jgi:hypothetical protein
MRCNVSDSHPVTFNILNEASVTDKLGANFETVKKGNHMLPIISLTFFYDVRLLILKMQELLSKL